MKHNFSTLIIASPWALLSHSQTIAKTIAFDKTPGGIEAALSLSAAGQHTPYDLAIRTSLPGPATRREPEMTYHYDSHLECSGALYHNGAKKELYVKGHTSTLLRLCDIGETDIEKIEKQYRALQSLGYDVVALAYSEPATIPPDITPASLPKDMKCIGLVAFTQTVDPTAKRAVLAASKYAEVVMLSKRSSEPTFQIFHQIFHEFKRGQLHNAGILPQLDFARVRSTGCVTHMTLADIDNFLATCQPGREYVVGDKEQLLTLV